MEVGKGKGRVDTQVAAAIGTDGLEAIRAVQDYIEQKAAELPAGWASGYLNALADDVRRVTGEQPRRPNATVVQLRAGL